MTLVTEMEKRNTKFSASSSCFTLSLPPLWVSLLFHLFCDAHGAAPGTVEGSGNRMCSLGRFLRTGFPHLWGLGPSVVWCVEGGWCVCSKCAHHCILRPAWLGGWICMGGQESHYRWGLLHGRVAGCCERPAQQVHDGLVEGKEA